ncbi:MAG: DUF3795 domain-containing protein, partial [Chloroflexi bacterium]|nr:DUF3795 domain-containing protein [Chloroflexota bacterium]
MHTPYTCGGLAVCSLNCDACDIHLRTPETLAHFASRGVAEARVACYGCRSDPAVCHWSPDCEILACARARRFTYCAECPDLPCNILT